MGSRPLWDEAAMTPGQFYELCTQYAYIIVPPTGCGEPYGSDDLAEAVDLALMEKSLSEVKEPHGTP